MKSDEYKIERFNSGAGGQQQNKHPKNVRLTHIPTGTVVTVRGRSYHKNVAMAKKEMAKRLIAKVDAKAAADKKAKRDKAVREHRVVRTYDMTTGIVKDHRTGRKSTIKKAVIKGELEDLLL